MELTEQTFRALARSSPWRWRSVHLTRVAGGPATEGRVEAWIRRPHLMRVVAHGEVHVVREEPDRAMRYLLEEIPAERGWWPGLRRPTPDVAQDPAVGEVAPVLGAEGLVTVRPPDGIGAEDAPMWQSYDWVAMLDPVELADGSPWRDPGSGAEIEPRHHEVEPYPQLDWPTPLAPPGTTVSDLRVAERHGRATWWARVVPTRAYEPRCSCCPLLDSEVADRLEYDCEESPFVPYRAYPKAHDVALDVDTGICVEILAVGGPEPGRVHDVRIHAVDEEYGDELFVERHRLLPRR